jgi:hypothetical protein
LEVVDVGKMYTTKPTQRRARAVWEYVTKQEGAEPSALWYNPMAWNAHPEAWWGWWVAEYKVESAFFRGSNEYVHILPEDVP